MKDAVLNDHLRAAFPESFRVMSTEETSQALSLKDAACWGIRDDGAHIILALTWHESRAGMLQKLASTKDLAKRIQHKARNAARRDKQSKVGELEKAHICGEEAWGLACAYEAQGNRYISEAWVFKLPKGTMSCCYTIYFYAREDNATASRKVLDEVIASLTCV